MVNKRIEIPLRPQRNFLKEDLNINSWESIEKSFLALQHRELDSLENLKAWLKDLSELEAVLEEDMAWRYIKMTIDTKDEDKSKAFQFFVAEIQPKIAPFSNAFNKKLVECPYTSQLSGKAYEIYLRKISKEIEIFREENIALFSELQQKAQKYGEISGGMSVEVDGEKITMQKAAAELQKTDRNWRERIWKLVAEERNTSADDLNELFTELVSGRDVVASNADYENFRDYKFDSLGRFDYSKEDCFNFHESISKEISPLVTEFLKQRKEKLELDKLKPWDLAVDVSGKAPLNPFRDGEDLISKSIEVFNRVDPFFGECLETMNQMGHLDLESKDGKAPGGYNYPLYEIGVPFIFMNAVGTQRDMITMMHEGGHAVHSFLTRNLELTSFQSCPSEVAELASMSMELISMDHWDVFYKNKEELKRAKEDHLQDILSVLPWIAIIDKFQHWIYENPKHTVEERLENWSRIQGEFSSDIVDWSGFEKEKNLNWQKQLHLFEVPFYYIEYGMAQLGAIAIWRNYKANPSKAISQYKEALALGYTKSIGEIYASAGILFDFSREYVKELADFVRQELDNL